MNIKKNSCDWLPCTLCSSHFNRSRRPWENHLRQVQKQEVGKANNNANRHNN